MLLGKEVGSTTRNHDLQPCPPASCAVSATTARRPATGRPRRLPQRVPPVDDDRTRHTVGGAASIDEERHSPSSVVSATVLGGVTSSTGFGAGNCPGQGRSANRRSGGGGSPKGTRRTRSGGSRPPTRNGRCTASGPSSPCTRASTRSTRSVSLGGRPHSVTSRPVAAATSSATRPSRSIPRG